MNYCKGWIGVDLDGTLAEYENQDPYDHRRIGKPIPLMVARVQEWIRNGLEVKVMTARVNPVDWEKFGKNGIAVVSESMEAIRKWCLEYIGCYLDVTCSKDYRMLELWDDRAIRVECNTGRVI